MKTGLTISALAHAALLLWGLISFSARPLEARPTDSLPVDIISTAEFTELTKGAKNAPLADQPKPLVEKVDEPRPADDAAQKITEKREIKTASAEPPPPPELRPAEAKPEKKSKPDPIAETLKKEEAKKKAEERAKAKQQQQKQQPKFDPMQIAALLDKRDAQRHAATGEALAPAPSLGTRSGAGPKLSQSELEAMRARLMQLWNPPAGVQNPEELVVRIRIHLSRDGRLAGPPIVLTSGRGTLFQTARDNAIRALFRGQPFNMLSPSTYETWKEIEITFDPRDMYNG
jgi:colicin import membrane protein